MTLYVIVAALTLSRRQNLVRGREKQNAGALRILTGGSDNLYGVISDRVDSGQHDQDSTASILQAPGDCRTSVRHAEQERQGPSASV